MKEKPPRSLEELTAARKAALGRMVGRILGFLAIAQDLGNAAAALGDESPEELERARRHIGRAVRALTRKPGKGK